MIIALLPPGVAGFARGSTDLFEELLDEQAALRRRGSGL